LKKAAKKQAPKVTQRAKTAPAPKKQVQVQVEKVRRAGPRAQAVQREMIQRAITPRPAPHPMAPKPGVQEFKTPEPKPAPQVTNSYQAASDIAVAAKHLPEKVAQVLVQATEFFSDLIRQEIMTECAPDAIEVIGAEGAQELETLLHEKKLTAFLMTHLKAREDALKDSIKEIFDLTGAEDVSVHGLWAKPVDSHSSKISPEILLKRGVKAADIEAATVKTSYRYIGIYDPRDKGPKGGSTYVHPEAGKGKY
jgi:hypothetical protein